MGLPAAWQFIRFCTVGVGSTLLAMAVLYLLADWLLINYSIAYAIAFLVAAAFGYLANRYISFTRATLSHQQSASRYFIVSAVSLIANSAALVVLVEKLGMGHLWAAIALIGINTPLNFWVHRRVSYRELHAHVASADPATENVPKRQ